VDRHRNYGRADGANIVTDPMGAAADAEVVFIMVPDTLDVEAPRLVATCPKSQPLSFLKLVGRAIGGWQCLTKCFLHLDYDFLYGSSISSE